MTFSYYVKNELIENMQSSYRQAISFLIGIIIGNHNFDEKSLCIKISLDNYDIFIYIRKLISKYLPFLNYFFNEVKGEKVNYYVIYIYDYYLYYLLDFIDKGEEDDINMLFDYSILVKNALLKGAYLGFGSLSDPKSEYHLEFYVHRKTIGDFLLFILNFFSLNSKIILRKDRYVIYIKNSESISEFLRIIGVSRSLLEFEEVRVSKEYSNNKNRITNCIEANEDKSIITSVRQVRAIMVIIDKMGIDFLNDKLREIALLRLKYKEASVKELGDLLNPPISKSGALHRLKKIEGIAKKLDEKFDD